jgi:hypothetical protein
VLTEKQQQKMGGTYNPAMDVEPPYTDKVSLLENFLRCLKNPFGVFCAFFLFDARSDSSVGLTIADCRSRTFVWSSNHVCTQTSSAVGSG